MKKVKWIVFNSLVLFLFLPGVLRAEEIGILPFRTTGVESYIEDSFYEFLEDELNYFDHKVVSPYEIEYYLGHRVICYNKDYAADYGTSLGLEKVIFGSIERVGDEYVISVTVVKSRTGEVLLIDKITLESEEHLDAYVYSLAEAIEEEVYGNDIYYSPHYSRTYTTVYIGARYPRHVIIRRPRRSLITVRLPLININLGRPHKTHKTYHKSPPKKSNPLYKAILKDKNNDHGRPKSEKPEHKKSKGKKSEHGKSKDKKQDNGKSKGGKEGHGKSKHGKNHKR